ncbi:MAG: PIG-L family deacetylase [Kiritimatiellaeota bacterium]|nr:PIG-L family deacetylase [Kiritimatiellota bacterium]
MKLSQPFAEIYIPDNVEEGAALKRATMLSVGAHQDDVEFNGFPLIRDAYATGKPCLGAVILTNGAGSSRAGVYANTTDAEMQTIRRREQRLAADVGRYAFVAQLQYPSALARNASDDTADKELAAIFEAASAETILTHNLLDRHDTHVATVLRTIRALRLLPTAKRPRRLLGAEGWRNLDWLPDAYKVRLDAGGHDSLSAALMGIFDSQIAGGKRYDAATFGRRRANATYDQSHAVDTSEQITFALDMTSLIQDDNASIAAFTADILRTFDSEIAGTLTRANGGASCK